MSVNCISLTVRFPPFIALRARDVCISIRCYLHFLLVIQNKCCFYSHHCNPDFVCVCVCVLFTVSLTHLYLLSLETSLKIRFIHSACVLYSMFVITVAHHNQLGCFCVVRLEIQFLRLKIQL